MQKQKERKDLANKTRLIEKATRKLTSGVAIFNDMVNLNGDAVWEHQNKWYNKRKTKDDEKHVASRKLFNGKKINATTSECVFTSMFILYDLSFESYYHSTL
jgi:hypothetical protein